MKAGEYPFLDIFSEIVSQSNSTMLSENGVKQGITKEKLEGTYVRPKHLTQENVAILRTDYLVEFI